MNKTNKFIAMALNGSNFVYNLSSKMKSQEIFGEPIKHTLLSHPSKALRYMQS